MTHIHPTACIDEGAHIGCGTRIWHFSHVLTGVNVGEDCNIGQNVVIGPDVSVGRGCKIQNNVSVYTGVTLEDGVFCGPSMVFTNVWNPRAHIRRMDEARPTLVREGANLGANCTVVCGVTIGRWLGGHARRAGLRAGLRQSRPATWVGVRMRRQIGRKFALPPMRRWLPSA